MHTNDVHIVFPATPTERDGLAVCVLWRNRFAFLRRSTSGEFGRHHLDGRDIQFLFQRARVYRRAEAIGGETPVESVNQVYLGVIVVMSLIHAILLPTRAYSKLLSDKFKAVMEDAPEPESRTVKIISKLKIYDNISIALTRDEEEDCALADITLIEQVIHPFFWACQIFCAFNLLRKYHILSC